MTIVSCEVNHMFIAMYMMSDLSIFDIQVLSLKQTLNFEQVQYILVYI